MNQPQQIKPSTIGVDFDGTVVTHDYPIVGREVPECVNVLRELISHGHSLVLNTMRSDARPDGTNPLTDAVNWFSERDIPLHGINKNPTQHNWTSSPKVYAHVYIDDAALGTPLQFWDEHERPCVDWVKVRELLKLSGFLP